MNNREILHNVADANLSKTKCFLQKNYSLVFGLL